MLIQVYVVDMNIGNKIKKNGFLEIVKWIGSIFLLVISVFIRYIFCDCNILIIRSIVFIFSGVAICILLTTKLGKLLISFGKEAYIELLQVVWPTYQDTLNITLVIIAVTILLSVVLWGLDTVLVHVISFGLRL